MGFLQIIFMLLAVCGSFEIVRKSKMPTINVLWIAPLTFIGCLFIWWLVKELWLLILIAVVIVGIGIAKEKQ